VTVTSHPALRSVMSARIGYVRRGLPFRAEERDDGGIHQIRSNHHLARFLISPCQTGQRRWRWYICWKSFGVVAGIENCDDSSNQFVLGLLT